MQTARYSVRRAARRPAMRSVATPTPTPTPTPAVSPGAMPTSFAIAPALHYHLPAGSAVTTQAIAASPSAVQAASAIGDLRGLAAATNAGGTGPIVMTDALGRRFLRFSNASGTGTNGDGPNGPNSLQIGDAFAAQQRAVAVFLVGRVHKATAMTFLSLGRAGSTPPNTGGGVLRTLAVNSGSVVLTGAGNRPGTGASTNVAALYPGSQMQVLGTSSRSVAGMGSNQGQRLSINLLGGNVDRSTAALSGIGATIGSYAFTPDTGYFDLYEMAVFQGELTDAQHDAIAASLVGNWAIPAVTDQIVLEGDSITAGILDSTGAAGTGVVSGRSLGMLLTEPGAELIPPGTRVVNQAASGNAVANLVARRDAAGAIFDVGKLPGRNIVAVQVGRNDWTASAASGTTAYNGIVALLNTAATGYLQRGWEVVQAINIATAASVQPANDVQRAALRSAQFLTDTASAPGQPYAGKVSRLELPLIRSGGATVFRDAASIPSDASVYQGNSKTHPSRDVGGPLIATGGETPSNGYGAIL